MLTKEDIKWFRQQDKEVWLTDAYNDFKLIFDPLLANAQERLRIMMSIEETLPDAHVVTSHRGLSALSFSKMRLDRSKTVPNDFWTILLDDLNDWSEPQGYSVDLVVDSTDKGSQIILGLEIFPLDADSLEAHNS